MRHKFNSMGQADNETEAAALELLADLKSQYTDEQLVAHLRAGTGPVSDYSKEFRIIIYDLLEILPDPIDLPDQPDPVIESVIAPQGLNPDVVETSSVIFTPEQAAEVFAEPEPDPGLPVPPISEAGIPAGSDAGQFFANLLKMNIADIGTDAAGQWHFKILQNGWIGLAGLGGFIMWNKMKRPAPRARRRSPAKKRKLKRA